MRSKFIVIVLTGAILAGCLASTLEENRPDNSESQTKPTVYKTEIDGKKLTIGQLDSDFSQLKIIENVPAPNSKSIKQIHDTNNSQLSFNGSFFSPEFTPLGLLVSEGKLIFPAQKSDLMNGVFLINKKGQPSLLNFSEFQIKQKNILENIDFAIQSGPILINQNGQIIADKNNHKKAGRTALGLTKNNDIILIMLRQSLLDRDNAATLYHFAELISESEELAQLGIHSVINLDGGNSSGIAYENEYLPELEKVQNIIITIPKKS